MGLQLLIVILLVAWVLGALVVPVGTSLIHVLVIIVIVLVIVRLVQGKKVL